MWQETVGTLEITGHFLCHSMLLYGFNWLVLIRFLLIKKGKREGRKNRASVAILADKSTL